MSENRSISLTGSTLKILAIVTMLIDHIGACVFEHELLKLDSLRALPETWAMLRQIDQILRLIGRVSFPIFCFLLVEGFLHTRDRKKYALRLFLFALISEIPFDLAILDSFLNFRYQNVFFTLFIGLLVMIGCAHFEEKFRKKAAGQPLEWMLWIVQFVIIAAGMLAAHLLHTDYSYKGVFLIALLYLFRFDRRKQVLSGSLAFCWELTAPLAFVPIWYYNGKRGLRIRWFFYWFYPVHLLLLFAVKDFVLPAFL